MKTKAIFTLALVIVSITYFCLNRQPKYATHIKEKYGIILTKKTNLFYEKVEIGDFDGSYSKTFVFDITGELNDIISQVEILKWQSLPMDNFRYGTDLEQFTDSRDKGYFLYKEDSSFMTNYDLLILSITNKKLVVCEQKTH